MQKPKKRPTSDRWTAGERLGPDEGREGLQKECHLNCMFSKLVAQNSVEDFVFGKTSWEKGSHSSTSTVDIMSLSQLLLWIFWLQLVISIGAIY